MDVTLLDCTADERKAATRDASRYVALGELKGGIDPAGADEHWKTARTALARIHGAFQGHGLTPFNFFVGAAVATSMALEIWNWLESGSLANAANLTVDAQVASLCVWLVGL